jgi:hypothetical protein
MALDLDPREVDRFVRPMSPRQELIYRLVYRLAIRGLCERCRGDRQCRQRTDALIARLREELPALLRDADRLAEEMTTAGR